MGQYKTEFRIVKDQDGRDSEIHYINDFAEIYEAKDITENENMLRVYCVQYPNSFVFQIRTFKPINNRGNGRARNMIAGVHLTIEEVEKILSFMKTCNLK